MSGDRWAALEISIATDYRSSGTSRPILDGRFGTTSTVECRRASLRVSPRLPIDPAYTSMPCRERRQLPCPLIEARATMTRHPVLV
jgi:hypothetical protein